MSYTFDTCPNCGGMKNVQAKQCRNCYCARGQSKHGHPRDICPSCGGTKDSRAALCKACRENSRGRKYTRSPRKPAGHQPNWDLIDETWITEFRGFFMGEGSFAIDTNTGSVSISLSLRKDDEAALRDIQEKLGGTIYYSDAGRVARWSTGGLDHSLRIFKLLTGSRIPCKKQRDIALGIEYIEWRLSQPFHLGPEGQATVNEYRRLLSDIRAFKVL